MTGPPTRPSVRSSACTSSASEVRGSGAATDLRPAFRSPRITLSQLEPSAQAPCASTTVGSSPSAILRRFRHMSGDKLIGDVVEIVADDVRLRADAKHLIAGAPDERPFPSSGDRAEYVPGVAGDKAKLRRRHLQFLLHMCVGFARGLVVFYAIGAESALEQVDDAAVFELAGLDLQEIVGEREQPEAGTAQLAQRGGYLRMRWHRRESIGQFLLIGVGDFDATRVCEHFHNGAADIGERYIMPGDGER